MYELAKNLVNQLEQNKVPFSNIGEMFLYVKNIVGMNRYIAEHYHKDKGYYWKIHGYYKDELGCQIIIEYLQETLVIGNIYIQQYNVG